MSSLMQFNGKIDKRGVHLQAYQTSPSKRDYLADCEICGDYTDVVCMPDGKVFPRIWTFARKPCGMMGCWVAFRINGKEQLPDLSCPQGMFRLPRDARPLPIAECISTWSS